MERDHDAIERPSAPDAGAAEEQTERQAARERSVDVKSGAAGAVAAIVISGLLVVGLWAVARNAPSAATDPRLLPVASPTAPPAAPERDGDQLYLTIVPDGPRTPEMATGEAGPP